MSVSLYEVVKDFGGTAMTAVQNLILIAAAIIAFGTLRSNSEIARRRATVDLIIEMKKDLEFIDAKAELTRIRRLKTISIGAVLQTMHDPNVTESDRSKAKLAHKSASCFLSKMELFAVAIRCDVADEKLFKQYYYSSFIEMVDFLRPYISEIREHARTQIKNIKAVNHDTLYQDVIWLLDKWEKDNLVRLDNGRT